MMARVDRRAAALAVVALMLLGPACGDSAAPARADLRARPDRDVGPDAHGRPYPTGAVRDECVPLGGRAGRHRRGAAGAGAALPGGAIGFSHYVFEQVGGNVVTTLVEGPRHLQVRVPASYRQLKEWADSGSAPADLSMSQDELSKLVEQLDTIRAATEKFRDVDVAVRAGYRQATEEVPNMGAHFVHPLWSLDGKFDPARPEILLYVRDEEGEWELVGTSFVQSLLLAGFDHPEAFVGPLDNWHVHYELCTGPTFTSRSATQAECRKDGGVWVPAYGWMIHAWVWVDNPLGVFTMWNPSIPPVAEPDRIRDAVSVAAIRRSTSRTSGSGTPRSARANTLAWSNADGVAHTVTAGSGGRSDGGFDSGLVGPGGSFQVTFDEPGSFAYTCTLHSFMSGAVVVTP